MGELLSSQPLLVAVLVLLVMFLFLGMGIWVFAALTLVSLTGLVVFLDMPIDRLGVIVKGTMWRTANTWELAAIPIFVWMGELIFRTDVSERLFRGLEPWVDLIPGRLFHTNIAGCTLFAAVSGSSVATTATIGRITTSALKERGYNEWLSVGSLAGAGSLGLMIPPSIVMIIYGVLAEVSIARLFAAGLFPGLLAAGLYSAFIAARCTVNPNLVPKRSEIRYTNRDRLRGLGLMSPILVLIPLVLGGIYSGLATPSEAAALGLTGTLAITIVLRQLTWKVFVDSLGGAVRITCMALSILVAAGVLSSAMGFLHIPQEISKLIVKLDPGPYGLILMIGVFYLVLGLFMEGLSICVMSLPITLPLIIAAGYDPIWFGIFLVITVELAQVTPPVGFNLFVLQALSGKPIERVAVAAFPFFLLLASTAVLLVIFPQIALWLPDVLY
ncbi:MAG: TRAP transporter large permease subunit [Pseudomonadota bacterium]|nr:TRAP transporter large permease subunit [Pseudomonadota bacterium]